MSLADSETAQHELNMFYHTWFGDHQVARDSALWLAQSFAVGCDRSAQIALQSNVCYALRVNGEPQRAYEQCATVYADAAAAGMTSLAALVAWNVSVLPWIHSTTSNSRLNGSKSPSAIQHNSRGNTRAYVIQEHRVRLAIVQRKPDCARRELSRIAAASVDASLPYRAAYYMAMKLGTATISDDANEVDSFIAGSACHPQSDSTDAQDKISLFIKYMRHFACSVERARPTASLSRISPEIEGRERQCPNTCKKFATV